jgi:hypothetical protein
MASYDTKPVDGQSLFKVATQTRQKITSDIATHNTSAAAHNDIRTSVTTVQTNVNNHISDTSNPHSVTQAQVGLANVDNTSDANKPVSTAQGNAIATAKAEAIAASQLVSDTKVNKDQGIANAGKLLTVGIDGNVTITSTTGVGVSSIVGEVPNLIDNSNPAIPIIKRDTGKVDVDQGIANANKHLIVNGAGQVVPSEQLSLTADDIDVTIANNIIGLKKKNIITVSGSKSVLNEVSGDAIVYDGDETVTQRIDTNAGIVSDLTTRVTTDETNITNLQNTKQDKIDSGNDGDIVAYTNTTGVVGTLSKVNALNHSDTYTNTQLPTAKAVVDFTTGYYVKQNQGSENVGKTLKIDPTGDVYLADVVSNGVQTVTSPTGLVDNTDPLNPKIVADTNKLDRNQGAANVGKLLTIASDGSVVPGVLPVSGVTSVTGIDTGLVDNTTPSSPVILHDSTKVNISWGTGNSGKILGIGPDGNVTTVSSPKLDNPLTWVPETVIDLGDGLYGVRIQGNVTFGDSDIITQLSGTVSGTLQAGTHMIVDFGGCAANGIPLGFNAIGELFIIRLDSSSPYIHTRSFTGSGSSESVTYDIWVKYAQ